MLSNAELGQRVQSSWDNFQRHVYDLTIEQSVSLVHRDYRPLYCKLAVQETTLALLYSPKLIPGYGIVCVDADYGGTDYLCLRLMETNEGWVPSKRFRIACGCEMCMRHMMNVRSDTGPYSIEGPLALVDRAFGLSLVATCQMREIRTVFINDASYALERWNIDTGAVRITNIRECRKNRDVWDALRFVDRNLSCFY